MRYMVEQVERSRVLPIGRDPLSVDAGDVIVIAVVRDLEHAAEVMQALNADDVRHKLATRAGKR